MGTTNTTNVTRGHGAFSVRACSADTASDADVAALVNLWRRSYQEQ